MSQLRKFTACGLPFAAAVCMFLATSEHTGAGSSVLIEVSGTLAPRCINSAFAHAIAVKDPSAAGVDVVRFDIDCNAPFEYSMVSQNGGLKSLQTEARAKGFATDVIYSVSMHIPLNSGKAINDTCTSRQIKQGTAGCRFTNSGNAVAIRKVGEMRIIWEKSARPLLTGTYGDKLIVTLAVRL